jgi:peptidoglycan-associated lipoprotein
MRKNHFLLYALILFSLLVVGCAKKSAEVEPEPPQTEAAAEEATAKVEPETTEVKEKVEELVAQVEPAPKPEPKPAPPAPKPEPKPAPPAPKPEPKPAPLAPKPAPPAPKPAPPVEEKVAVKEEVQNLVETAPTAEAQEEAEELLAKVEQEAEILPPRKPAVILAAPAEEPPMVLPDLEVVYFDFDKSDIKPSFEAAIRRNFAWMQENPNVRVQLEGHCDERGTNEYNLALGERRARAVYDYLVQLGANPRQLTMISFGEERPAAAGNNESAWSQNRRVEFTRL